MARSRCGEQTLSSGSMQVYKPVLIAMSWPFRPLEQLPTHDDQDACT